MNPIREAIRKKLIANSALTAKLGDGSVGVYYQLAPATATLPWIIFDKSPAPPIWTFAGPPLEQGDWIVKAVASDAGTAEDIDALIRGVLNRTDVNPTGYHNQFTLAMSDINYPEVTDGERYQHVGAVYRIATEKETA